MTTEMIIFVVFIFVWLFFGFMMLWEEMDKKKGTNWWGIIWMAIVPFISIIAKFCGLL